MSPTDLEILIGLGDIADITGFGRSAVSNWRKRHDDFPAPRVNAAGGAMFDLHEIEAWLLSNGKIDRPVAPRDIVWRVLDTLRSDWTPERVYSFTVSALVLITTMRRDGNLEDDAPAPWATIPGNSLPRLLRELADEVENSPTSGLFGLVKPGLLEGVSKPDAAAIRAALNALRDVVAAGSPTEIFDEAADRLLGYRRQAGEQATPPAMTDLLVGLVEPLGENVVDPASGIGGLLLEIARRTGGRSTLWGCDISEDAIAHAKAWFAIYGYAAQFQRGNALTVGTPGDTVVHGADFDTVVLDPPAGLSNWSDPETYRATEWPYPAPPLKNADLAWPQVALKFLREGGRAAVVLPIGSTFRAGSEADIRRAMLRDGVVEALIELPPRMRTDTSIQFVIWLMRHDAEPERPVLLVDASSLGSPGRKEHDFDARAVTAVIDAVRSWRDDDVVATDIARAVTPDELTDTIVTPSRYVHPPTDVDPEALRIELEERRAGFEPVHIHLPVRIGREHDLSSARRIELGQLAGLVRGSHRGRSKEERGDVPVVASSNLQDPSRPLRGVSEDDAGYQPRLQGGELLVALEGQPSVLAAPPEWEGAVLSVSCARLETWDGGPAHEGWIELWLRSSDFQQQVARVSQGSTIQRVRPTDLLTLTVPVPDRATQLDILYSFEQYDQLTSQAAAALAQLERMRELELALTFGVETDGGE